MLERRNPDRYGAVRSRVRALDPRLDVVALRGPDLAADRLGTSPVTKSPRPGGDT
jgi:hypothetical protein